MSNITRATVAAGALIISERRSEKISKILSASDPGKRDQKEEKERESIKGHL